MTMIPMNPGSSSFVFYSNTVSVRRILLEMKKKSEQ